MWDALRLDVRHSLRSLRRAPTFSLIVIVTLALAVGATAAVGSLLNAVVLRRLAVPSPEQLVALSALEPGANVGGYFYADTFNALPRRPAILRADVDVRRRRHPARRDAFRRVRGRGHGSRLAELLRHRRRATVGGTVLQRLGRCGGRDQRGLPPAHLRQCHRHRRGDQVQRGAGDGDRHRGGRF